LQRIIAVLNRGAELRCRIVVQNYSAEMRSGNVVQKCSAELGCKIVVLLAQDCSAEL